MVYVIIEICFLGVIQYFLKIIYIIIIMQNKTMFFIILFIDKLLHIICNKGLNFVWKYIVESENLYSMNIVVLDAYTLNPGDLSWSKLEALGNLKVYDRTLPEEIVDRAKDAEIVLVNKVVIDGACMEALPNLKYIGVLATGYNVVDVDEARKRGIVVTNIPAYSTDSVAQMVFAHILNIVSRVDMYASQNRNGRWSNCNDFCYYDSPIMELAGKRMGIVGLGHTGMATARIADAFGMKVVAFTSKTEQLPYGIEPLPLDEIFATCDIVSLHCPLNERTRGMVDARRLGLMKKGAILINTGRGPLVCEKDVADALSSGRLGAFGADVLSSEPPASDNPLLTAPNCFITPHIAWATVEARTRLMDICAGNVKAYIDGAPVNRVD